MLRTLGRLDVGGACAEMVENVVLDASQEVEELPCTLYKKVDC